MKKVRTAILNGIKYDLSLYKNLDGLCTNPRPKSEADKRPLLCLPDGLRHDRGSLENLLHELLHACGWSSTEAKVEMTARDLSKVLWRLMEFRKGV